MSLKRLAVSIGVLPALVLAALLFIAARPAAAQTSTVPDMTQFGYPQVGASVTFTPGQAATLTAGNQQVVLPADFISKTVKFELLMGDPSSFAPLLTGDDVGRPVLAAFAFRVTDMSNNKLVGRFDKPVQWSITDPSIGSESEVYNTSPTNPPKVTANSSPGTVQGNTLSHPFGGAGVGWLVLNPMSAPVPVGMPATGNPSSDSGFIVIAALAAVVCCLGGLSLRRRGQTRG